MTYYEIFMDQKDITFDFTQVPMCEETVEYDFSTSPTQYGANPVVRLTDQTFNIYTDYGSYKTEHITVTIEGVYERGFEFTYDWVLDMHGICENTEIIPSDNLFS